MEYIVGGYTMVSDVYFKDGSVFKADAGGSAYSVGGIKLWRDSLAYVGTAGKDFEEFFGQYYSNNDISLFIDKKLDKTLYYVLHYAEDGSWSEECKYGEAYERLSIAEAGLTPEMFKAPCGEDTKGIYIEAALNTKIVHRFVELKSYAPIAKLMWEIEGSDLYDPEKRGEILSLIPSADCYSMNVNEGKAFFDTKSEERVIKEIRDIDRTCFLRAGEKGAYWIEKQEVTFVPSFGAEDSVDATGCGNASTAAALIGYAEGLSPKVTVAMANISAYFTSRQHGVYPVNDADARKKAYEMLNKCL